MYTPSNACGCRRIRGCWTGIPNLSRSASTGLQPLPHRRPLDSDRDAAVEHLSRAPPENIWAVREACTTVDFNEEALHRRAGHGHAIEKASRRAWSGRCDLALLVGFECWPCPERPGSGTVCRCARIPATPTRDAHQHGPTVIKPRRPLRGGDSGLRSSHVSIAIALSSFLVGHLASSSGATPAARCRQARTLHADVGSPLPLQSKPRKPASCSGRRSGGAARAQGGVGAPVRSLGDSLGVTHSLASKRLRASQPTLDGALRGSLVARPSPDS